MTALALNPGILKAGIDLMRSTHPCTPGGRAGFREGLWFSGLIQAGFE